MCLFWIYECFAFFFLLRDVFESLKCCLDLCWVACLIAFISLCFSSLWKIAFYQARQLLDRSSTNCYLSSPLDFFSQQILSLFRSIELSGICLNSFSTDSRSIKKISVWLIAFRHFPIHRGDFAVDRFSTAPQHIHICQDLVLDRSSIHRAAICLNRFNAKSDFIPFILSWEKKVFSPSKHSFLTQKFLPMWFLA